MSLPKEDLDYRRYLESGEIPDPIEEGSEQVCSEIWRDGFSEGYKAGYDYANYSQEISR